MKVEIVVAVADNHAIGRGGQLPWHLPADLRRFREITMGGVLVMGRRTYESIGRPLPGRLNIVLSRKEGFAPEGVFVTRSLDDALRLARSEAPNRTVFVVGGEAVYREALPHACRLHVTRVGTRVEGDRFFPPEWLEGWRLVHLETHPPDARNPHPLRFETYERIASAGSA